MEKLPEQQKEYEMIIGEYLKFLYDTYNISKDDIGSGVDIYSGFPPPKPGSFSFYKRNENIMFDEIKNECLTPEDKVIASDILLQIYGHGSLTNNTFILPDTVSITFLGAMELMTADIFDPFVFYKDTFKDNAYPPELNEIANLSHEYSMKYTSNKYYGKELYTVLRALRVIFNKYNKILEIQATKKEKVRKNKNKNNNNNNVNVYQTFPPSSLCPDIKYSTGGDEDDDETSKFTQPIIFGFKIYNNQKNVNVNKLFMFNNISLYLSEIINTIVNTFLGLYRGKKEKISEPPINIQIFSFSCLGIKYSDYLRSYPRYLLNRCLNLFPSKYNLKHLGISPYDQTDDEIRRASFMYDELGKDNVVYIRRSRLLTDINTNVKDLYERETIGKQFPSYAIPYDKIVNDPNIDFLKLEKTMSTVDGVKIFTFFDQVITDKIYQEFQITLRKHPTNLLNRQNYRCTAVKNLLETPYFREWAFVIKEFPEKVKVPPQFKFLIDTMLGSIEQLQWLTEQLGDSTINKEFDYVKYMMKKGYKNLKESSIQDGDFTKDKRCLNEIIQLLQWILHNDMYHYHKFLNKNLRYEKNDLFTVFLYTLKVLANNYLNLNYKYGVTSLVYNIQPPSFQEDIFPFIFPSDGIRYLIQEQLPFYRRVIYKIYETNCQNRFEISKKNKLCADIERQIDTKLIESEPYLSSSDYLDSLPCFFIFVNSYLRNKNENKYELDIKGLNEYLDKLYPSAENIFDDKNMSSYTPDRGLYFLLKQFISYIDTK